MKHSSKGLSADNTGSSSARGSSAVGQLNPIRVLLIATASCVLLTAGTGCESLQKKLARKSKPAPRPSPVISFEDYTRAMTPLDRYRKHYALFDYWNAELLDELQSPTMNPKRARGASSEALQELKVLQGLVQDAVASQIDRMIGQRAQIDQQLQRGSYAPSQRDLMRRDLESQTRQVHRVLFWRKVEGQLKETSSAATSPGQ